MVLNRVKKHTKKVGGTFELLLASELSSRGYDVFKEVSDSSRTDLIVKIGPKLIKVQVKHAKSNRTGAVSVTRRHSGPTSSYWYSRDDVDVFAIYSLDLKSFLFVPFDLVESQSISIRVRPTKHGQKAKTRESTEFLSFEKVVGAEVVATSPMSD